MAARMESVAKYIADCSQWSVSNLKLQKLMYLAQMVHMGQNNGAKLFEGTFQAWDYGPVVPELYHKIKRFGGGSIKDVFSNAKSFREDDYRRVIMDGVCSKFSHVKPGDLVEITHADGGAWEKVYKPGAKNIIIPDKEILNEFKRRKKEYVH